MFSIRELYFYASPGRLGDRAVGGVPLLPALPNGAGVVSVGSLALFHFSNMP